MQAIRSSLIAGGSALVLALSLAACGGGDTGGGSAEQGGTQEQAAVALGTDAEVEPALINPGWVMDSEDSLAGTSDFWVAEDGSERLYFTHAANDAGLDVTFVGEDDTTDDIWDLEVEDGHLKTLADAEDKRQVDITFQDNFTCYDAVGGIHYVRGYLSQEEYDALIAGKAFVQDPDDPDAYMITFDEDGTVTQSMKGNAIEGTWEVQTPNVVVAHFESWDTDFRWDPEAEDITELDDGTASPLVLLAD